MEIIPPSKNLSGTHSDDYNQSQNQKEEPEKKEEMENGISSSTKQPNTSEGQEKSTSKNRAVKKKKKETKKKEEIISNESNEINENINSQDNADFYVEINQDENYSLLSEKETIFQKKEKSEKCNKRGRLSFRGYSPFSFYEKERFKGHNNKKIKQRDFVKQISMEWKNMSEEEKEPYIQQFLDFKKSNCPRTKLIQNKRKRVTRSSCGESFTNKKGQFSTNNHEIKKFYFSPKKKINNSYSESKKSKNSKLDNSKDNYEGIANEYLRKVIAPLVEMSYDFFKKKGIINDK